MESDNWIIQNLENALSMWNSKLKEIWSLLTQTPDTFKDGAIWGIMQSIHGTLQAIAYALLVLFFVVGVMKTCGSFAEVKKKYRTQQKARPPKPTILPKKTAYHFLTSRSLRIILICCYFPENVKVITK